MRERLRVAFDVTPVITGRTGIARYLVELGRALESSEIDVRRLVVGRAATPPPDDCRWVRVPLRIVQASWRVCGRPRAEDLVGGADLVHAGGPVPPPTRRPLAVTVHDLTPLDHPELNRPRDVSQSRAQLERARSAEVVLAGAVATATALAERGVDPARIVVTSYGVTRLPPPADHGLGPAPFLLAVGETSPRKDYPTLVRAFAGAEASHLRLVLAGPDAAGETELRETVVRLGLGDRVVRLPDVTDAVLAALYRDALALCFPSVAEGFGLPVLEAMAAGLPVAASDLPVLREVTGGAARHVPVGDHEAWVAAIDELAADAGLRERLGEEGRARSARFTWAAVAEATIGAYRSALGG